MPSLQIKKLADALGAEVSGVDLSQPLPARTFAEIRKAWLDHLVLRFRGQRLSDPQLIAFSRLFGELDPPGPNPYGKSFLPEFPEVNVISNIKMGGAPIGGLGDGEAIWHADMTYIETPPMAAILHALELPPSGGDTYWANMYLAYEARIRKPAGPVFFWDAGAIAIFWECRSMRAKRCSTSSGRMRHSRNSPFASNGARAMFSSGTTVARCIGVTASMPAPGG
jgi:alpha-ketoglutarate-dependent taurine dioxygenase